ncbi:MAG: ubiquinol-cytochrome C chaperone family protein [Pseudomonadota bacterium]|nr:ubiquinol-cytochrome C chaperone family protein [Pseudomonadota bacterium]
MLQQIFRRSRWSEPVHDIYNRIVKRSREPCFYKEFCVPDTLDGRFEMLSLHLFLVLRRLRRDAQTASKISQDLFDYMFEDMDLSLREMGAGDMGVGKRIKAMVQAFYGRVASYEEGLADPGGGLEAALKRNVYGMDAEYAPVAMLASYVRAQDAHLETISQTNIEIADFEFGAVL